MSLNVKSSEGKVSSDVKLIFGRCGEIVGSSRVGYRWSAFHGLGFEKSLSVCTWRINKNARSVFSNQATKTVSMFPADVFPPDVCTDP